jgi:threonine/homoserine/homoserine lactone efflux protein
MVLIPGESLAAFFMLSLMLAFTPGPDNMFVLSQSLLMGWRAGLVLTAGFCTGLLFHTTMVAVGVAALIASSDTLYQLLKLAGSGYLLYLAWRYFCAPGRTEAHSDRVTAIDWGLYWRGVIMNATNPKVTLFFLALLPQFIDGQAGSVTLQLIQLAVVFLVVTVVVFGSIALFAGQLGRYLSAHPRTQPILNRLTGLLLLILAINLWIF